MDLIPIIDIDWAAMSPWGKNLTPIHLALALGFTSIVFGVGSIIIILATKKSNSQIASSIDFEVNEQTAYAQTLEFVKTKLQSKNKALDAIIVCGGGRPSSATEPPLYVQSRCDISVLLYNHSQQYFGKDKAPKILCLSAGTAHTPQLLHKQSKLPIWESYASGQYILNKYSSFVNNKHVYMETVSYDTIGNAYFAKVLFSDVLNWKNIAVITNDWHFKRTKAIFEWIYNIKDSKDNGGYNFVFVNLRSVKHKDLNEEERNARIEREEKSLENVYKLQEKFNTLQKVHGFLHLEHSMYACSNKEGQKKKDLEADAKLMAAYGFKGGLVDEKKVSGDDVTELFKNIKTNLSNGSSSNTVKSNEQTATI